MWLQEGTSEPRWNGWCLLSIHVLLGGHQHPDFAVGNIPPSFSAPLGLSAQSGQEIQTAEQCLCHLLSQVTEITEREACIQKAWEESSQSRDEAARKDSRGRGQRPYALLPRLRKAGAAETLHGLFKSEIAAVRVHGLPIGHLS